ncbi:hypothetical protein [Streptomyces sp. CA-251247]|uniref:hypothetical protein n=1 Tax=Streptomyces sp. CA-251247 TaxID=3240062 RepID=UPI003D8C5843
MVVELKLLLRREMAAHSEIGGVLDQRAFVRHPQSVVDELARLQRDESVPAEEPGADGRPFGYAGGIVEIHLVHSPDLGPVAVERLAADQAARIDVGLHGPSKRSQLLRK